MNTIKSFTIKLIHPTNSRLNENWEIYAHNKTEARKLLRRRWRQENGYSGWNYDDFKIQWVEGSLE
jgi:hypothetical protein